MDETVDGADRDDEEQQRRGYDNHQQQRVLPEHVRPQHVPGFRGTEIRRDMEAAARRSHFAGKQAYHREPDPLPQAEWVEQLRLRMSEREADGIKCGGLHAEQHYRRVLTTSTVSAQLGSGGLRIAD